MEDANMRLRIRQNFQITCPQDVGRLRSLISGFVSARLAIYLWDSRALYADLLPPTHNLAKTLCLNTDSLCQESRTFDSLPKEGRQPQRSFQAPLFHRDTPRRATTRARKEAVQDYQD